MRRCWFEPAGRHRETMRSVGNITAEGAPRQKKRGVGLERLGINGYSTPAERTAYCA